jgi:hypothetical protein
MTIAEFGEDVRTEIAEYLSPAVVVFRGSFAAGTFDEFSDVDLQSRMDVPLDADFFAGLEYRLQHRYGAALVRYDPDYRKTTTAQDVRFSFYSLPVFWRVDLLIESNRPTAQKHPHPFPEWSIGTSALMNAIWALKHLRRGRAEDARHYFSAACHKIGLQHAHCTMQEFCAHLAQRNDVDSRLLAKTREEINAAA